MVKKDATEKKPVRKTRAKKVVAPTSPLSEHEAKIVVPSSPVSEHSQPGSPQEETVVDKRVTEAHKSGSDSETGLKPVVTKSWAAETEDNVRTTNVHSTLKESVKDTQDTSDLESDISDGDSQKLTSFSDESFFDDDRAKENNSKVVNECNEKELLEILWKRGKDNLNIALRTQVVKLYRMLNGERLHKERPQTTRQRNPSHRDFKGKGKFRKDDFPSRFQGESEGRYQKDNDNRYQRDTENRYQNDDNSNANRWNRKRPPYRGRNLEQAQKS